MPPCSTRKPAPIFCHPAQAITQATSILHANGWAEPRTTVRLYDDGVQVTSVEAGAEGRWNATLSLVDGTHVLTATATDPNNNTSEFSLCETITSTIPSLSVNNVTVSEGDSGTITATFTVSMSAPSASVVTVAKHIFVA